MLDFLTKATAKLSWSYIRHITNQAVNFTNLNEANWLSQMSDLLVQYTPFGCASTWLSPHLSTSHMALVQKCTDMTAWCLRKSSPRQNRAGECWPQLWIRPNGPVKRLANSDKTSEQTVHHTTEVSGRKALCDFTLSSIYQNELVISFTLTRVLASISWLTQALLLWQAIVS